MWTLRFKEEESWEARRRVEGRRQVELDMGGIRVKLACTGVSPSSGTGDMRVMVGKFRSPGRVKRLLLIDGGGRGHVIGNSIRLLVEVLKENESTTI